MSMFLEQDGEIMSFRQFCLSEAIKPKQTSYGIDDNMSNGLTIEMSGYVMSFFKDDLFHAAGVHKHTGEVIFGTSEEFSLYPQDYTDDRTKTRNAMRVFSKVMYVITEIAKNIIVPYLRFNSANPALGSVYDMMVRNKPFLRSVEQSGFNYEGKVQGEHIFKRVEF